MFPDRFPDKALRQEWLQHSSIYAALDRMASWRNGSALVRDLGLGTLLAFLLAVLPYLSNNQTGAIAGAITFFWVLLWLGDRVDKTVSNWSPIHLPVVVYWGIASLATLLSPVKRAALDGWVKLSIYFLLFFALHRVMQAAQSFWRSRLVATYLITTLAVCVYGLRQHLFGAEALATWVDPTSDLAGTTRIYSFLGNPNLLAGYLMPAMPLSIAALLHWRAWGPKIAAGLAASLSVPCILLTYSRGGLIGLVVESLVLVLLLAYWWGERLPKWSIPGLVGGTAGMLSLGVLVVPALRSRVLSIFLGRNDSSNNFRINVWSSVLKMIQSRPLLGIGPGNRAFNQIYPFYQRPGFSALGAYSVPLEIFVETGIIGFACYTWLVFTVVRQGWQKFHILRAERTSEALWIAGAIAAIAGMLAHGLVDTVWYRPQVQILWWVAIALVSSFCSGGDRVPREVGERSLPELTDER